MITAKDIKVAFGKTEILHSMDFEARPGEVTAIVGPNGSGKTTLLKAITQEAPYSGEIAINGKSPSDYQPWELAAKRAVLPQAATLAFPFTVQEVIRLGLSAGVHGARQEIVHQALARVGLNGYANRTFHELSGGEQQRAHLARVLCQVWTPTSDTGPNWMLLDEPVASLDIAHQLEVMDILGEFARGGGGVVTVMHDLNLTAMVADKIVVVSDGRVIAQGATETVFTNEILSKAYGCTLQINQIPPSKMQFVLPHVAKHRHSISVL